MKKLVFSLAIMATALVNAQTVSDSIQLDPQKQQNAAQRILSGNYGKAVTVGGYGEMLYNQPEGDNGTLDVQRLVMLFGYKFDDKIQFVTEIEFEHVQEVYVEQAFINYNLANNVNLRGGLMLVPMGIINEFHEPTTFNGTNRPSMDKSIVPTTWRELGVGVSGKFNDLSLGYQAYIFNGFKSVTSDENGIVTGGLLGGSNGLRGGRQKGIESTINSPNLSLKFDYYGLPGLRLGLSGYFGKTQAPDDVDMIDGADVGLSMIGLDARYAYRKFMARGQYIIADISGSKEYNALTGQNLGSQLSGYYIEGAYNLLPSQNAQKLFAFARYEKYDTHAKVDAITENLGYDRTDITLGLTYHLTSGVVAKADYQFNDNAALPSDLVKNQLNFGLGVWF
ncbi:porin [Flavobacterium sp.]|jgi:hypothetical protein|uniref:porin n=1 Tax=Flavobacterium sp. TaxID=239 RepID=UPI003D2E641F